MEAYSDKKFDKKSKRRAGESASSKKQYVLCTNHETMFRDPRPTRRLKVRTHINPQPSFYSGGRNPKKLEVKSKMEVQGSHRTLFYRQPSRKHISSFTTVVVDLEDGSSKKVSFGSDSEPSAAERIVGKEKSSMVITLPVKSEKMATKETQTDFRDSEAQTVPWKHEIRAEGKLLSELMTLEWFHLEKNFPPGTEEVTLIENARQKLEWENVIAKMRGKEHEEKRKLLVVRLAATEAAFKEAKIEDENRERLDLSRRKLEEERQKFLDALLERLTRSYRSRRKENDSKIRYWNHQLNRKVRKLKSSREESEKKLDIISLYQDKTSDLYAPKIRDGENPSRRHEIINIQCRYLKRYHGLSVLEKYMERFLQPKIFKSDFKKEIKPKKNELCLRKFREKVLQIPEEIPEEELIPLKVPVPAPTPEPPTPRVQILRTDSEENLYQACLLLGRLVKGRAIQTKNFLQFLKMSSK